MSPKRNWTENADKIASACLTASTRLQEALPDLERVERDDLGKLAKLEPADPHDFLRKADAVADPKGEIAAIQRRLGEALNYLDRADNFSRQHRAAIQRVLDKQF
jgi:hypothetical protein